MKKAHLLFIAAGTLMLLATVLWGMLYLYAAQNKVPAGVTVGGLSIGGLQSEQALKLLDTYWDRLERRSLAIEGPKDDIQSWSLRQTGYRVERNEVRKAILRLSEGSLWTRAKYRFHFVKHYEVKGFWNEEQLDSLVTKQWGWMEEGDPVNAQRIITADDRVVYRPEVNAFRPDTALLFKEIKALTQKDVSLSYGLLLENSRLSLKLPIKKIVPDITLERLKAEGVARKIMSFTTDLRTSAAGRTFNVTATARTLNDWELAPDEVFDYVKVVQTTEEKYGYREAPVILNGELVPGIGGGICQVSSTLYNAALRAGLEIVERRSHSLPVSYLPKGQDATFAEGAIDFRFRNSTGKHIIIRSEVVDGLLTVKLFGTMPANVRYNIESKTVRTIKPPVREVASAGITPGGRAVLRAGKPGYVVETYRTLVRDGAVVSRERISRDIYRAQPTLVGVSGAVKAPGGSGGRQLLEDGVKPDS